MFRSRSSGDGSESAVMVHRRVVGVADVVQKRAEPPSIGGQPAPALVGVGPDNLVPEEGRVLGDRGHLERDRVLLPIG